MIHGKGPFFKIALLVLVAGLFVASCGSDKEPDSAIPTFCPDRYLSRLALPLAANTPPRAYYQDLTTEVDTPLEIVLYTCDPDHPRTSEGLSWELVVPPLWDGPPPPPYNGDLSAYSGMYPDEGIITYTPDPGFVGTDSFPFNVWDGEAWSNTAEIRITVSLPPITGQNLYFGGRDDLYRANLWYYDGASPIATVYGSAQALSLNDLENFRGGLPYQDRIFFIVADSSGENNHLVGFDPGSQSFQYYPELDNVGELAEYGAILYATGQDAGTSTTYLWYFDDSVFSPIPATATVNPYSLQVFNDKLYFAGDDGSGNVQMLSYNAVGSVLATETATGSNLWPWDLTVCNGMLYFNGTSGPYQYLWSLDGISPAATVTNSVTSPENMICYNNELYFTAMGAPGSTMPAQLWSVDSGDNLTRWTTNTSANFMFSGLETYPVVLGSDLYLRGNDDSYTNWIWAHDGISPIATVSGSDGLFPFYTKAYDGRLFFASSYLPGPSYGNNNLGSFDPGTGNFTALSNVTMGLNPRGLIVYPP